ARIERLAKEFAEQKPAVAFAAGAAAAQSNGLFNAAASNALTALVGSVGTPGGIHFTPIEDSGISNEFNIDSRTQVLFLDGSNPVFTSLASSGTKDAIAKIPYIVSFGNFIDETSVLADLILPDHSFLESWVNSEPESGAKEMVSVSAPPAMRTLHDTRSTPDVLLEVGRRLKTPLNLPWQKFE